ncbi:unnamed protein product, partial [Pylaiella littoralis]
VCSLRGLLHTGYSRRLRRHTATPAYLSSGKLSEWFVMNADTTAS